MVYDALANCDDLRLRRLGVFLFVAYVDQSGKFVRVNAAVVVPDEFGTAG